MKKFILLVFMFVLSTTFGAEKIKVACVGDSITFGARIDNPADKYPQQLNLMLGDTYDVQNFGVNGATLLRKGNRPYVKFKEFKNALALEPDIVIIKLGTNDSKLVNFKHIANFSTDLNALIDSFLAKNAKARIYLCTPAKAYLTGDTISEDRIAEGVIPVIKKVAEERNLTLIDLHEVLSGKEEMFPDKIHPDARGAKIIAETVKNAILADKLSR